MGGRREIKERKGKISLCEGRVSCDDGKEGKEKWRDGRRKKWRKKGLRKVNVLIEGGTECGRRGYVNAEGK